MATLTLSIGGKSKATSGKSDTVKWLLRHASLHGFPRAKYLPSDDGAHDIVALSPSVWAELDAEDDGMFRLHRQDDAGLRSGNWWPADDGTDLTACLALLKRAPVVQAAVKADAPDDVPVAAAKPAPKKATPTAPEAAPAAKPAAKGKAPAARKVNGNGKLVRKPARRKPDPKVAVVKFLTEKQQRESFYLRLFKQADPSQSALIPTMLVDVARIRGKEADVHGKQGREADRERCLNDVVACSAVANLILAEKDKATRSRLQDIDDRGLARLVELADLLSGHAESVEDTVEVLAGIKGEVLAAIDQLVGPADPPAPTKPKKAAQPAPKAAAKKAAPTAPEPAPEGQAEAKAAEVQTARPIRRPAQANPKPKAEAPAPAKAKGHSHKEVIHLDGPSPIERGDVTAIDERVVVALRAAVDDAIYSVARRFNLNYKVFRGRYAADGAEFRIGLETKDGKAISIHRSDDGPIVPVVPQGKALPPITKRLSEAAMEKIRRRNNPKKARKAAAK